MRESFYTQITIYAKTILEHTDTMYEGSCMAYETKWYQKHKYPHTHTHAYPLGITIKIWDPPYIWLNGIG